ncbi:MAG: TRM11 family SAM-dependent methyltransferase [Candidatus Hermodarchaeota archaeon]
MSSRIFLFGLGRDSSLSLAEIVSYFDARAIPISLEGCARDYALIRSKMPFNVQLAMKSLGGTVRIGEIYSTIPTQQISSIKTFDWDFLFNEAFEKFKWAISFYSSSRESSDFPNQVKKAINSYFKKKKIKANYKWPARRGSGSYYLDPSDVNRNKMTSEGFECIIVHQKNKYYIGKTISVFNAALSESRDLGRPQQLHSQAISLRLARILINLSQVKPGDLLLDPFCGIGTLLQEAIFLKICTLGVEIEPERVKMAQENLKWFQKKYPETGEWKIILGDSRQLIDLFSSSVDGVATEPFLGPLLHGPLKINEARKLVDELERFYRDIFQGLEKIVKPEKKVAIVLPVFPVYNSKSLKPNLSRILEGTNFRIFDILKKFHLHYLPYTYRSQNSHLTREIYVFKKTK